MRFVRVLVILAVTVLLTSGVSYAQFRSDEVTVPVSDLDGYLQMLRDHERLPIVTSSSMLPEVITPIQIRGNQGQLKQIEDYAMSSDEQFKAVTDRLFSHMDAFVAKYHRGAQIPVEISSKRTWKMREVPTYGLVTDAIVLLDLARRSHSMEFDAKVLSKIYDLSEALEYCDEHNMPGGTERGQLAWLSEKFLVQYRRMDMPRDARSALDEFLAWRKEAVQPRQKGELPGTCIPSFLADTTLEYVNAFASNLDVEHS